MFLIASAPGTGCSAAGMALRAWTLAPAGHLWSLVSFLALAVALAVPAPLIGQILEGCPGGGRGGAAARAERAQSRLCVTYDKEQDVTLVGIGPVGRPGELRVSALFECQGREPCVPGSVQMIFATASRFAKLADDHGVTLLADGESMSFPDAQYLAQPGGLGADVQEVVAVYVLAEQFLRIARAKKVECTIGPVHGPITGRQLEALRSAAKQIERAM